MRWGKHGVVGSQQRVVLAVERECSVTGGDVVVEVGDASVEVGNTSVEFATIDSGCDVARCQVLGERDGDEGVVDAERCSEFCRCGGCGRYDSESHGAGDTRSKAGCLVQKGGVICEDALGFPDDLLTLSGQSFEFVAPNYQRPEKGYPHALHGMCA